VAEKHIKEHELEDEEFFDAVFEDIEENGTVYIIETANGDKVALVPANEYEKLNKGVTITRNHPA
jgi:hypothetical protein